TNLARLCINEGGLERAGRLIEPLFKQRRMHVTEFAALSSAYIHLRLAQGDVNAARDWFEIWSELTPGIPAQELWRRDLAHTPLAWLRRRVLFRRRPD
ncbi:MAG TPA: hypothetical protein VGX76_14520, partial [Pirellulales bacterium]|nr:hypothetical protein [Pirellulales bacterium]